LCGRPRDSGPGGSSAHGQSSCSFDDRPTHSSLTSLILPSDQIVFGSNLHSGQTCVSLSPSSASTADLLADQTDFRPDQMCTERAIVVDSVYDEFERIIKRKGQELAAALAGSVDAGVVAEMAVSGEKPAAKVRGLVEDALRKVSPFQASAPALPRATGSDMNRFAD
jgi:hypothetical protein